MPFHAIPMPSGPRRPPVGLLLVEGLETRPERDLLWFAHVLGEKLLQLRARPQLQDSGLERERRLLFSLINAVSDPILLTDAQGKLITGNARAEQLLAATSESDGHRRALELNNLFFSSALAGTLLGLPDGSPRDVVLVDPGDGSDLLFELLTTPIQLDGGQSAFVSVLRNVTDLGRAAMELKENYTRIRSAEAQARAERNRIELVIDSVVDPIIVSHPNGEILMTNKPADALFTSRASDAATRRRTTANVAQFSSFTSGLLLGDGPDRIRGRLALTDPESARAVPVEAIAAVVPGESDLVAVVTVLHDLTEALEREHLVAELKTAGEQLEERVRDATAELAQQNELLRSQAIALEHASAAKSQFLASISHEFRTPLNAILGYTWLLLQGTTAVDDPEARRMMSKIDSNSRHLAALINTVLDMTRIEADQMPVEVTRFHAAALVREVLEELEAIVSRSKVPITVTAPGRMRPIETDRQKLKQILVNLLTNAVKFTRDGGITVEVSRGAPGRCRIAVRDTGIGIPIEEQSLIFEAFEQGHGARRLSSGTGLGLAISRRLVGLLGGQILVASTVGVGSTFSVEIPSRLPADATADDTPPHRERSKPLAGARA
jgi:signal transduction histidine kinase